MRVVLVIQLCGVILTWESRVDYTADGSLRRCVRRGDLDFLEADNLREGPTMQAGTDGRLGWRRRGSTGGGLCGKEGPDQRLLIEIGSDSIDVPGIDT